MSDPTRRPRRSSFDSVRTVVLGLAVLAVFGSLRPLRSQAPAVPFAAFEASHLDAVRLERERWIRELWVEAPAERRDAAIDVLERRRRSGARALETFDPRALAEAWRALQRGTAEDGTTSWQAELVDSLDLRIVPGAFEARAAPPSDPLTVHVRSLFAVDVPETVVLSLYWRGPGEEEVRARSEPVVPEAWARRGFEMYVRAPLSPAASFRLVAELEHQGRTWRGFPIRVDCVADLGARVTALERRIEERPSELAFELAPRIAARLEHGVRDGSGLSLGRWLDLALGVGSSVADGEPEPLVLADFDAQGADFWTFGPSDAEERRGPILVLALTGGERADAFLSSDVGRAWYELQRALGAVLVASDLPALETGAGATLTDLLDVFAATDVERELVLVARGEAGVLLPARLRAEGLHGLDGLVLCGSPAASARPLLHLAVPVLALDSNAPGASEESGGTADAPWTWIRRREPAFLADLHVPADILEWWASQPPSGVRDGR